jgi:heme-degrading monooxygenase HmoA
MPFISITRLRVRSWRFLPAFFVQAIRSARQAKAAPGNLGVSVLREDGNIFWTRTVWDSEASMKSYILEGVHHKVMRKLLDWCDEAAVAHWTQASRETPTWPEAHTQLERIGRPSKVDHPSEAHSQFRFSEPQVGPGKELRW